MGKLLFIILICLKIVFVVVMYVLSSTIFVAAAAIFSRRLFRSANPPSLPDAEWSCTGIGPLSRSDTVPTDQSIGGSSADVREDPSGRLTLGLGTGPAAATRGSTTLYDAAFI